MLLVVHTPLADVKSVYVAMAFFTMLISLALLALWKDQYPRNYAMLAIFILRFASE